MKKIALVAALPVVLTLAACGETADETPVEEETTVVETAPVEAPMADDTMATDDTMMADDTAADTMAEEAPVTDETAPAAE